MAAGLQIAPLGPAIGALVSGIDLREPLSDAAHDKLLGALLRHHVLFFENQPVTPQQQRDLAARFGGLHIHPIYPHVAEVPEIIVLDTDAKNLPDNDNWHTDVTFIETPPMGALAAVGRRHAVGERHRGLREPVGTAGAYARRPDGRA